AVRIGQPAEPEDDWSIGRDRGEIPAAALPVLFGKPARQPGDVHAGARVTEPFAGRLLVAQLLPGPDAAGHGGAAGYAPAEPAAWVLQRCLLRGLGLREEEDRYQDPCRVACGEGRVRTIQPR